MKRSVDSQAPNPHIHKPYSTPLALPQPCTRLANRHKPLPIKVAVKPVQPSTCSRASKPTGGSVYALEHDEHLAAVLRLKVVRHTIPGHVPASRTRALRHPKPSVDSGQRLPSQRRNGGATQQPRAAATHCSHALQPRAAATRCSHALQPPAHNQATLRPDHHNPQRPSCHPYRDQARLHGRAGKGGGGERVGAQRTRTSIWRRTCACRPTGRSPCVVGGAEDARCHQLAPR